MRAMASGTSGSWLQQRRQELVDRGAEQMLGRMQAAPLDSRSRPASSYAALVLSLLVHLSTLALVAVGVLVLVDAAPILKVFGVLPILLAMAVWPRDPHSESGTELRPDEAPMLFDLLTRVAELNDTPMPRRVVVDDDFNASVSGTWRRTLTLGAAMWMPAAPQARVALLGHELGHFAHADTLTGWWVWRARTTLDRWRFLLTWDHHDDNFGDGVTFEMAMLNGVLTPARIAVTGVEWLLFRLDFSAGRRQEYLADLDAIAAGGTDGARDLFELHLARSAVETAVTRAALRGDRPDPWAVAGESLAAIDAAGRASRRTAAERERARVDDSHPQTWMRLRLVDERPWVSAGVVLDLGTRRAIDAELAPAMTAAGRIATERVRYTT